MSALEEAISAIHKSQENMAKYYNQQCTPVSVFYLSDKIFLNFLDI